MGHNYSVEYKKGKENKATNALSRQYEQEDNEQKLLQVTITNIQPQWMEEVKSSYQGDEKVQQLLAQTIMSPEVDKQFLV